MIESVRLSDRLGASVVLASEAFQWTGSFKYRAAGNVARSVPHPAIITASSGNFGQALAFACKLAGKACTVVMPANSARVKIDAVRFYGATVDLVDTKVVRREDRVAALAAANPAAYVASAYDDPLVIQGNATLGRELAAANAAATAAATAATSAPVNVGTAAPATAAAPGAAPATAAVAASSGPTPRWDAEGARPGRFDAVLAPIGGGGLCAGIVTGLRAAGDTTPVWAVEPAMANDFVRSLAAGQIVANDEEPQTIADGTRTRQVGVHDWDILRSAVAGAIEVSEDHIREAVRLCFNLANVKAEPTGALALAALLAQPERFHGQRVCCIVSGGNVDPSVYTSIVGAG